MARAVLVIMMIVLHSVNVYAELSKKAILKREKIISAISKGIVDIYDIPLNTYIRLRMWEHIEQIFKANAGDMLRHSLPGTYQSRPYIINNEAWIFDSKDNISVMKPDNPNLVKRLKHKEYLEYEGSIRTIFGHTVISGGGDKDVDMAVLWNIKDNTVKTLKLKDGHYITSIAAAENMLHIGSCGGKINEYQYDNLKLSKVYSTSSEENSNWEIFNRKECISAISVIDGKLIGVGEKNVFIWAFGKETPVKKYSKIFHNSFVSFYQNFMIEYKQDEIAVIEINNHKVRHLNIKKPVEDILITKEKVLKDQSGDILIVSLRDNGGFCFYDFKTLNFIEKTSLNGYKLAAAGGCIFSSDDRFFYRYFLTNREPEKFSVLLKNFRIEDIAVNEESYYRLLKLAHDYPDIIPPSVLARKFLELHRLSIDYSFKYGKIGERTFEENGKRFREEVFGYKLFYELANHSDKNFQVSLDFSWSGSYEKQTAEERQDNKAISKQSCIVGAYQVYSGNVAVGEKEPLKVLIYPTEIRLSDKTETQE